MKGSTTFFYAKLKMGRDRAVTEGTNWLTTQPNSWK